MCRPAPGGTPRTEEEVDELVRQFDADGDGMLSMEEIAKAWAELDLKTSYWDEVGEGKPNASALKRALADTVLVDAAWLAQLADEGGVLPRCQDLPPGARVMLEDMEKWEHNYNTVGVLVISYPWWALRTRTRPLHRLRLYGVRRFCTWLTAPPSGRTGWTPTTRTRMGCNCVRSRTC